ncbi:MAG: phosphoglycerate kinase [Candidatus Latescibacteria bacterium]|jgi:phosphoglycerate kinase|nr:phosphoglycerate kinase [Candidatus Latescibacterota bacterium]
MAIKTVEDIDLKGMRVIVRCDFNVPLDENLRITDEKRIVSSLPTIRYILKQGAKLILMSHLGRPKGKRVPEMSLAPVSKSLSSHLNTDVKLASDCVGQDVEELVSSMKDGDVLLLENLRFHDEETGNDSEFAEKLASIADVYVNDAFGTAHRAHASTEGITHFMDNVASGYLLRKEIDYLDSAVKNPERPFVAIIGGVKISSKIDVLTVLLDKADVLIVGGGMAYTFFKAMGFDIGNSVVEDDKIDLAHKIMKKAESSRCELLLPVDCMIADRFANDAETRYVDRDSIPGGWESLDIGPKTGKLFVSKIKSARTVVWNGPMGVFEMDTFAGGTRVVADALAEATKGGAITIIGGGDSAAAIAKFGMENQMSHISTGGGASLELLEGKVLPGMAALDR